jgi:hypothetical protein
VQYGSFHPIVGRVCIPTISLKISFIPLKGVMKMDFSKIISKLRGYHFRMPCKHSLYHQAHNTVHCTYLGAVFKEAHGFYGYAAGVLLVIVILGFFIGEAE